MRGREGERHRSQSIKILSQFDSLLLYISSYSPPNTAPHQNLFFSVIEGDFIVGRNFETPANSSSFKVKSGQKFAMIERESK